MSWRPSDPLRLADVLRHRTGQRHRDDGATRRNPIHVLAMKDNVKIFSFTAHPDRGWSCVTPSGVIVVEPGMQVTIAFGETWEQTADAIRDVRTAPRETKPGVQK